MTATIRDDHNTRHYFFLCVCENQPQINFWRAMRINAMFSHIQCFSGIQCNCRNITRREFITEFYEKFRNSHISLSTSVY